MSKEAQAGESSTTSPGAASAAAVATASASDADSWTGATGRRTRGQHVLHVVRAAEGDLLDRAHRPLGAGQTERDGAVPDERPLTDGLEPTEPEEPARGPAGQRGRARIVGIDDGPVAGRLAGEEPRLGAPVRVERSVAVEMVRREVEESAHPRPEAVHRLELEARHL